MNAGVGHYLMQKIKASACRRVGKLEDLSVDRIDNELGYIEGNLVLTTKEINMFRRDKAVDKFIELCSQVANHFNNK